MDPIVITATITHPAMLRAWIEHVLAGCLSDDARRDFVAILAALDWAEQAAATEQKPD